MIRPHLLSQLIAPLLILPASQAQQTTAERIETDQEPAPIEGGILPATPLPDYTRDPDAVVEEVPLIQLALLLDTSSSMQGLIHQAKEQLWAVVNAFVKVTKDGADPVFQVALYEYGRNSLDPKEGFVRKVIGLTGDLDRVSQDLMALQATNVSGSSERPGRAIYRATQELAWSPVKRQDIRAICVAGNESFAQGEVDYRIAGRTATEAGIRVHTVFCGTKEEGLAQEWAAGAERGGGTFTAIDHNALPPVYRTPQDDRLSALNTELNGTFIPYNRTGSAAQDRQVEADAAAEAQSESALLSRVALKSGKFYRTEEWDLVDAWKAETVKLDEIETEFLPEEMRDMSAEEIQTRLEQAGRRREDIRRQITELSEQRAAFIEEEQRKLGAEGRMLDRALIESLRQQAKESRFEGLDEK